MALVNTNAQANGLSAAVRDLWLSKNFMLLFTQRSPLWGLLKAQGNIKPSGYGIEMREGLSVPVTTGPAFQGIANSYTEIPAQAMTGFTSATYNLAMYGINISSDDYDMKRAGSPTEEIDWQQGIMEQGVERAMNKIMDDLWRDPSDANSIGTRTSIASILAFMNGGGTGATDGGASPKAQASQSQVPLVLTAGTTAQQTIGGIPRNSVGGAYWCIPIVNGDPVTPGSTALTVFTLSNVYNEGWQDNNFPNLIIMPDYLFSKLQNLITVGGSNGGTIYNGNEANIGYNYIQFRGAKIVPDRRCPTAGFFSGGSTPWTNQILCLNTKYLRVRTDGSKPKFKPVPTTQAIDQQVGYWYLALTSKHLGNVHSTGVNFTS